MILRIKHLGFALLTLIALQGCKTRKAIEQSPLRQLSENAILEQLKKNNFEFNTLTAKLTADVESPSLTGGFKINMRIANDSLIWMSLTPALGIEAVRMVVEEDSIRYINKVKKEFYAGGFSTVDSILNYQSGYNFLQDLLVGNPADIEAGEKYTATVEDLHYVLHTKVKRNVKKAIDVNLKKATSEDTLSLEVVNEKQFEKATEKHGEDDLILKRYFVRADDFRIGRIIIDDILYQRTIRIEYGEYIDLNGINFPQLIKVFVSTPKETARFDLRYTRIKTNEPQSYPFKIPSAYKAIN